ncbi:MAG: ABC transporter permease [Micromonosporaceae bacterium]
MSTDTRNREPQAADATFGRTFWANVWSTNPVTVTVCAFILAMAIGGLLVIVSDPAVRARFDYFFAAPGDAISASLNAVSTAYTNLFKGSIVDPDAVRGAVNGENTWTLVFYPISETLAYAAPLIFTGLAVALAFRSGLFNIGAQGQAIMGAVGAGVLGFGLSLPAGLHLVVAILGGIVGGALWGLIPGALKARTGAHEVITTIMMNYIALYFLGWLIIQNGVRDPARSDAISKQVPDNALLPHLAGASLRVHLGILLALATCAGIAWLLNRSTLGFEIRAVGSNPDAARTAGMSVGKSYTLAMGLAGALAGLGGTSVLLGTAGALTGSIAGNVGFDGITVALLGRARPWGVALAGLLFGAFKAGANRMQSFAGIPIDMVDVLQALIVLFIAAPAFIKTVFQLRAARAGRLEANMARGW